MPKIKFKAGTLRYYSGVAGFFNDGDEKQVSDDIADYLVKNFPDNFSIAGKQEVEDTMKGPAPENTHKTGKRSRK